MRTFFCCASFCFYFCVIGSSNGRLYLYLVQKMLNDFGLFHEHVKKNGLTKGEEKMQVITKAKCTV